MKPRLEFKEWLFVNIELPITVRWQKIVAYIKLKTMSDEALDKRIKELTRQRRMNEREQRIYRKVAR